MAQCNYCDSKIIVLESFFITLKLFTLNLFMGIKDFFLRKMVESKMKDVPKEQQEQILTLLQSNPEFFQKIAVEIEEETKKGKDQMAAAMTVMQRHQDELKKLMGS